MTDVRSLQQRRAAAHRWFLIRRALLFVLLAVGLGIMFYPAFMRLCFLYKSVQAASEYDQMVSETPGYSLESEWQLARAYNEARMYNLFHDENTIVDPFMEDEETKALNDEYAHLLNLMGNGVMGYIDIPKIHQRLNIYHGTDEDALMQGVGHVQGTSLPVGGESSHCVLSAHRGLSSAKMFTDLDQIEQGDQFYLHVLGHDLAYEVDDIRVVKPSEISSLEIMPGEDLVTLLTCTPYAVNTHRLLVRGHSVPYQPYDNMLVKAFLWLTPAHVLTLLLLVGVVVMSAVVFGRRKHEAKQPAHAPRHAKREQ